jgi:hypothetical protein
MKWANIPNYRDLAAKTFGVANRVARGGLPWHACVGIVIAAGLTLSSYAQIVTTNMPVPFPGLVAAYSFDEGSGTTVFDASGNGNNGIIGGATWTTSGKYGNALVFDGVSSLVTIPNSASLQLSAAMTLEAWVNPSEVSNIWQDVIYKANDIYYLEGTSGNGSVPGIGGTFGASDVVLFGTAALPVNTWTHLAATYDGTTMRLYVNGTQVSSQAQTGAIASSTDPLQIGGDSLYGQFFQGTIDEVRIYNVALTAAQIQADMNTPVGDLANLPATDIQATTATLNGQVFSTGGSPPGVTIYYGTTNGGTNAGAWENAVVIGTESNTFSLTVPGLSTNTTYFYTAFASNSVGNVWAAPSESFTTLQPLNLTAMLTYHNDNSRDGANTNETALTLGNVNVGSFSRLFSYPIDGYIYAQPLVMTNVNIPGKGVHNVVYVATENDTVYAFDADSNQGINNGLLWSTNLGVSAVLPNNDFGNRYGPMNDVGPNWGITGTPVIDPGSGTIYLAAFTFDGTSNGVDIYNYRIHALDIATGSERSYSPVLVAASVPGTGVGGSNGTVIFNAEQQMQRPGLTLVGGKVYVAFGSFGDTDPYHGWVLGFNATNLQLLSNEIFNTTPSATVATFGENAGEAGIWMSGDGLCVDANTNLYFATGNGSFSEDTGGGDYGDSFVRLSTTNGMAVADYFTPYNEAVLAANDRDLGSGGTILLPDSAGSTAHPHLMVGCGKDGTLRLVDRDNMGHFNSTNDNQIVQELPGVINGAMSTPAYFNNQIYYQGVNDLMKAFYISNAVMATTPVSESATSFGYPGATPSISASGTGNAIAWAIEADAYTNSGPAILHAYNATNLTQELYNSSQNLSRDNPGGAVRMTAPTIANGKVYVCAEFKLSVFGVGIFLTAPVIAPSGGTFNKSVTVTLAGAPPGVSLYYTLDGTVPTTNSILYAGPFTLTNSALVQAVAAAPGAVNSAAVSNSFTIVPAIFFTSAAFSANGQFQLGFSGVSSDTYILEATTNFVTWTPLNTNLAPSNFFDLFDAGTTNFPYRFYRVQQQ